MKERIKIMVDMLDKKKDDWVYVSCEQLSLALLTILDGYEALEARLAALEHPVERLSEERTLT